MKPQTIKNNNYWKETQQEGSIIFFDTLVHNNKVITIFEGHTSFPEIPLQF